jgi:predicted nuclease of predicted toxin-antitoxin system
MKILIDMNLPPQIADLLIAEGIDAKHWHTVGAYSAKDSEILSYAVQNDYIVLTYDLDFTALLAASPQQKPSVVQVRTQAFHTHKLARLLAPAIKQNSRELEKGAILSVDAKRVRVRLLPLLRND